MNRIGRITPAGAIDIFPIAGVSPGQITAGPDQNMWFTEHGAIGRITASGVFKQFSLPYVSDASPLSITSGPDGNIWYTTGTRVGRLTLEGNFQEFETGYDGLSGITSGPDGNIWFLTSAAGESKICRITPSGDITQFGAYGEIDNPQHIVIGPDGNLWFTQQSALGRITPGGMITQYRIRTRGSSIVSSNGELWVADGRTILRITIDGIVRGTVALPPTTAAITEMTVGPGRVWLAEDFGTLGDVEMAARHRAVRH